jgi:hypothetical protein
MLFLTVVDEYGDHDLMIVFWQIFFGAALGKEDNLQKM